MSSRNVSTKTTAERLAGLLNTHYAKKTDVSEAISTAISTVYKPGGSLAAESVSNSYLITANEGKVYNLNGNLTLDSTKAAWFVDGASGDVIPSGTNIVVVENTAAYYEETTDTTAQAGTTYYSRSGSEGNYTYTEVEVEDGTDISSEDYYVLVAATYLFDKLAGFIDLSGKADKVSSATDGNIAGLDSNGNLTDSGIAGTDVLTASDISDYTENELKALLGIPVDPE